MTDSTDTSLHERVDEIINLIRPAIQSDGGDLELVEVSEDGEVRVRLHGACVTCPSRSMTLRMGIERNLKQRIPEITHVAQVP
ncbi:NifU family protein [Mucisphaera calidilacus]|uniref:Fe/S biogenesis protein NfuA n=1 Tax=Mucisphaera calidilacus TaxID=2527982 RepID=A0A518BTM8_9BACT|nr:NifU family protein [Mucisphaera calidilacus]QDU70326.1 Fe/S biogenesis protein NfuA [Mucisphaera calidilacus]